MMSRYAYGRTQMGLNEDKHPETTMRIVREGCKHEIAKALFSLKSKWRVGDPFPTPSAGRQGLLQLPASSLDLLCNDASTAPHGVAPLDSNWGVEAIARRMM